jgi:hypothetical protein
MGLYLLYLHEYFKNPDTEAGRTRLLGNHGDEDECAI